MINSSLHTNLYTSLIKIMSSNTLLKAERSQTTDLKRILSGQVISVWIQTRLTLWWKLYATVLGFHSTNYMFILGHMFFKTSIVILFSNHNFIMQHFTANHLYTLQYSKITTNLSSVLLSAKCTGKMKRCYDQLYDHVFSSLCYT